MLCRAISISLLTTAFTLLGSVSAAGASPASIDEVVSVTIRSTSTVISTSLPYSIGVTLDFWNNGVYGNTSALNIDLSPRLLHFAKGLSPGILRIGGSNEDSLAYEASTGKCPAIGQPHAAAYHCSQDPKIVEGCLTNARWVELAKFAADAGLKFIFGLNGCLGRPALNASLDFGLLDGFLKLAATNSSTSPWGFEIGNELDGTYRGSAGVEPEALGRDINTLGARVAELWPREDTRPRLFGPDIAAFTGTTQLPDYFERFVSSVDNPAKTLSGMTFHQYPYCDSSTATTILDNSCLDKMQQAAQSLGGVAQKHGVRAWVGESANCWTGGVRNVSDVFLDAFYYATQLQIMATNNVPVVIRQTLVGGTYDLVNHTTMEAKPSYWMAYAWKRLVGLSALNFTADSSSGGALRTSVHCGPDKGTVTVLINLSVNRTFSVTQTPQAQGNNDSTLQLYLLTGDVYSTVVKMNGKVLSLPAAGSLPDLVPVEVSQPVSVPPGSIAFVLDPASELC